MAHLILRDLYFNKICASVLISNKIRRNLYKWGGVTLSKSATISPRCFCGGPNLEIGENSFINYEVWLNTAGRIIIGKNCNIAYRVTFVTSTHSIGAKEKRAGKATGEGITVGDGTWIGANVTILPGVHIGSGVIIGAGSVVTKDCDDNCLYAGNPARLIRILEE